MGALESNAGDDFHFWWAATRVLALIEPDTEGKLVVVEGLSRVDDPDDEYEAVDVTEYIGGDDLDSASVVVLSQLKHSTRHPGKVWTVSRLCQQRTRRAEDGGVVSKRSLIADLAGVYAKLLKGRSRDDLLGKVRVSLVSNQPGDSLLHEAIAEAARWSRARDPRVGKAALLRALPTQHAEVISKLADAVGSLLNSGAFCDFLAVLDLSPLDSPGRAVLARSVRAAAAALTPGHGPDSARRLFDLVRNEAQPESRREGIRAANVLAELGVADPSDLYPAPPRLASLDDPLPAPGARAIADLTLAHPGAVVVAHGAAGAGKTTALRQLDSHLPEGSMVALFDCYGGGEYLSSGEERHTPQRFVTQMVNDLAQRCGTSLLIHPPAIEEDLWRRLRRTLEDAVATLDEDALLILAIDAADNAAHAADERGDRGFLPGLFKLPLPPRVAVVLTARSHRVDSLDAPGVAHVELAPFDAATSAAHLRRYMPDVSETDAAKFHDRTGGNPRSQYYALTKAHEDGRDMASLLEVCARTPEPLFKEVVDSALQVSCADAGGQRWLALMLALARPINTETLAAALDVDPANVTAFAHGLTPGVALVDGSIQFRDEDFETYVRLRVDPADVTAAHNRLADMFLTTRTEDPEAAAHVADHLAAANRFGDILRLVLGEDWPVAIPDGFRRAQVQGRRLDLAARAAAATGRAADAVRIAVRACDSASRLDTLSSLAESHFGLVARYADIDSLRAHVLRQSSRGDWLAPVHLRLAAGLARDPVRHAAARAELEHAEAWLRRWMASPEGENRGWRIDADDVACAAEARYRLDGPEAAVDELRRWRPAAFAMEAAVAFAARVAAEAGPEIVRETLHAHNVPAVVQAPFLAYATSTAATPDRDWVDEIVAAVLAADSGEFKPWHLSLIDVAVRHGDRSAATTLTRHLASPLPAYQSELSIPNADGVAALRIHTIRAALDGTTIEIEELVPPSLRPSEGDDRRRAAGDDARAHRRREWIATAQPLLAAAQLAARSVIGDTDADEMAAFVNGKLAGRTEKAQHRWFTYDRSYRAWATLTTEAVIDTAAAPELIDHIADAAPALIRDGAPDLWLDLAASLTSRDVHTDRAADLCFRAAAHARTEVYSAPDRLDLLARAAEITADIDAEVGRKLFDRAVDAATGINDDAARLLNTYADLASRAAISREQQTMVAARLIRVAEAVAPYVTDSDIVPYDAVVAAAGHLDPDVALPAAARWDDEDRIPLTWTLPAALLGAIDGGGFPIAHAIALDHLIEDEHARLKFLLAVLDRAPKGAAGTIIARTTLQRAATWVRRDVAAAAQPALANRLLDWATKHSLDQHVRTTLEPVTRLAHDDEDRIERWRDKPLPPDVQALLDDPPNRSWETLADDVAKLDKALVYGEKMREFIDAVIRAAPPGQRMNILATVADLPCRARAHTIIPVLAGCLTRWRDWPQAQEWAKAALPTLIADYLPDLALRNGTGSLLDELRAFDKDNGIRRAILSALPEVRARLAPHGWQNIAALLGRLSTPDDAAEALTALLADRLPDSDAAELALVNTDQIGSIPLLLWSAFGHPRRAVRWRAAHATRDLLRREDFASARALAGELVACLDRSDAGPFRDPTLHFYRMSATVALLVALQRVATERPDVLVDYLPDLIRHATSRELPHAQIREMARQAALALAPADSVADEFCQVNQPVACLTERRLRYERDHRRTSDAGRYNFDPTDTIPYWYTPLARVFGVSIDVIAERAERWIIDQWGLSEDDWWRDARELRDQRSYERTSHRQGVIPPEEKLRLYLEYHAMMAVAGELIDARLPVHVPDYDDAGDPWRDWLAGHIPCFTDVWLADLRYPVPAEPDLFGHVAPLDEWDTPTEDDYNRVLGLTDGSFPDPLLIGAYANLDRPGAYGTTCVSSALVVPDHAADLQRALAAATNSDDWKLPGEDEKQFEVDHGPFNLRGWLAERRAHREGLDEHDPYARGLFPTLPLPGRHFRSFTGASPDQTGTALIAPDGAKVARAEQWADESTDDTSVVSSSGYRVYVAREPLLRYLADTGSLLIVEVQLGRHRHSSERSEYAAPRSRVYLIDSTGRVTSH